MRTHSVLLGSLTIAAVGLFVACGDGAPAKPSPLSTSEFAAIEVIGPDSLHAGQSAQFVANVSQADGTVKSATSMPNLRWRSSDPSVMSVSNSGLVTASLSGSGEAVITADITTPGAVQGTRKVAIRPKAEVTVALEVSLEGTPGKRSYVFAVKLSESAGVAATVTDLWITLDDGWSGQCRWTPDKLGETRLPANGTLSLDRLTCDNFQNFDYEAFSVQVSIALTDDNGYKTGVDLYRELVVR